MKEIERVVTEKDHFDNRGESFLISTFWKLWKIKILMQGSISTVFESNPRLRIQDFLRNTYLNLKKKPEIVKFWEILLFQSHSTANLLPLAISKKLDIFFGKKPEFGTFWETLRVQSQSTAHFKTIGWIKNRHSNTWTTNIGSFMRAWLANLG